MGITYGSKVVTDGLQICLDASNPKCITSASKFRNSVGTQYTYSGTNYSYPTLYTSGAVKYFNMINDGTTSTHIQGASNTYNQRQYTRMAWIRGDTWSGQWCSVMQNSIGNNADMGLTIMGGYIHFHQYNNTNNSGTSSGDYGISGTNYVSLNEWHHVCIAIDLDAQTFDAYVDGVGESLSTGRVIGNSHSNTIVIGGAGSDSYSGGRMFKGDISMVMHYNRKLTAEEVKQNFEAHRGRYGVY